MYPQFITTIKDVGYITFCVPLKWTCRMKEVAMRRHALSPITIIKKFDMTGVVLDDSGNDSLSTWSKKRHRWVRGGLESVIWS